MGAVTIWNGPRAKVLASDGILSTKITGGTTTTSSLIHKTTTGVGTTGADHIFQVGNNGATEAMRILNNGNVGIGTTTPSASLHVNKTAPTGTITTTGTAVTGTGTNFTTAFSVGDQIVIDSQVKTITAIADATNLTIDSTAGNFTGIGYNRIGSILNSGNVGIGVTTPLAKLSVVAGSTVNPGDSTGLFELSTGTGARTDEKLAFGIKDGSYSWIQAVKAGSAYRNFILNPSGGNVGIGTTTPSTTLEINSNISSGADALALVNSDSGSNTTKFIGINLRGTDTVGTVKNVGYIRANPGTANYVDSYLTFATRISDVVSEKMRITAGGNVGIGTVTPTSPLHVVSTSTASSGVALPGIQIASTINQTSTAGATDLLINRTQTAAGSGIQSLIDAQVGSVSFFRVDNTGKTVRQSTMTAGGTTGAQTINKPSGSVNFAAAATSIVVTNSTCNANSIVTCVIMTNDATAIIKNVVPAAGSFTINLSAAATAETKVGFIVNN